MKKQRVPVLLILTIAFLFFTLGFYAGRNGRAENITLSIPQSMQTEPTIPAESEPEETEPVPTISFPIDINTSGKEGFMALPGIGETLAARILAYREETGGFTRVEDILNVKGIGKTKFEEMLPFITIGG